MYQKELSFTFLFALIISYSSQAYSALSVEVTSPVNGSKLSNSISLSVQIQSAFTIQQVVFYRDNWIMVGIDKTAPFSMTLDSKQLTNGAHTFFAVVTDTANSTVASAVHTVSISNTTATDLAALSLKMTAPQAQANVSDR